jgi:putative tricarboxylic transport membrane protein
MSAGPSLRNGSVAVAAAVLALAVVLAVGAAMLPVDKGYTIVGTRVFPLMVACLLAVVGAGLLRQALRGDFAPLPADDTQTKAAGDAKNSRWHAAAWVSAGLLLNALLIERIGFVAASTVLFAFAARGFGSRRWGRNIGLGVAIVWPVYLGFTLGLNIGLPGLFKPWF